MSSKTQWSSEFLDLQGDFMVADKEKYSRGKIDGQMSKMFITFYNKEQNKSWWKCHLTCTVIKFES